MAILRFTCVIGIVCISFISCAQELARYHRLSLALLHANVPSGIKDDKKSWLTLPAYSLDYDYWLVPKWAIGLHTDLIIENYFVETIKDEEIERSKPVAIAAVAIFKPEDHLSFLLGPGTEIAEEGSLFLIRVGAEYGWEFAERWELGVSLLYDAKWESYDSWMFGLGVSRIFNKR